ncbi:unnamed protein product [Urochloa humidicola]
MRLLLRRSLSAATSASGRLGRALSTAASRPPWAMIYDTEEPVRSPGLRASFQLAEPPCASHLRVPENLINPRPRPDPDGDIMPLIGGGVRAASGDGLLLLDFMDEHATAPVVGRVGTARARQVVAFEMDPDRTRFVCNPRSGQLFRLPDIDGTKKTSECQFLGILTQSESPNRPPDRYAVAWLSDDDDGSFVMRRFLSQKGEWDDKLVDLPSPLLLARKMFMSQEVVAFAGRLWWVDVSWGAVSVDPFSDRPELRFVELPRGSVTDPVQGLPTLGRYRRMGFSEGRMRYAEVCERKPYVLSSFALEDDGSCWTLEHRVVLDRIGGWADGVYPELEEAPHIGVIDPFNASVMILTIGNGRHAVSVDMDRGKALRCSLLGGRGGEDPLPHFNGFLKPCVLPPWLGSTLIPSAGTRASTKSNFKSKTLADILVRVDRCSKN